jgi:hypothetical protein
MIWTSKTLISGLVIGVIIGFFVGCWVYVQVISTTIVLQGRTFVASYTGSLEPVGVIIGYDSEGKIHILNVGVKNTDGINSHNGTLHVTVEGRTTEFASANVPMLSPDEEKSIIVNIAPSVTPKESTVISVNVVQAPLIGPLEFGNLTKSVIEVRAEGEILHYQNQSFWSENGFSEILSSKQEFEFAEINSFNNSLQKHGKVMVDPKVEFNEENKSTTLICDIKGAMYSTNSYDFHWLLADLPFDLYAFKQSEKELTYQGEINSVPTTIKLIFPYTLAHCHEHVWPST